MNVYLVIRGFCLVIELVIYVNEEFVENYKELVWCFLCCFGGLFFFWLCFVVVFFVFVFFYFLIYIVVVFKLLCYIFVIFWRICYVDYCVLFLKSFWFIIILRLVFLFGVFVCSLLFGSFCEFFFCMSDIWFNIMRGIFFLIRFVSIFVFVEYVIVNC